MAIYVFTFLQFLFYKITLFNCMIKSKLNRSIAPKVRQVQQLELPKVERIELDNGLQVYLLNSGSQEVMKIELVFPSGRPFEDKRLASRATIGLLKEGTKQRTGADIAELMDFYGASLSMPFNLDDASVVLYGLTKHLGKLLPLLTEIVSQPIFPQHELDAFVERSQQRLKVDLSKEDNVAYRAITEYIFGADTPYGYNSDAAMYAAIQRADLLAHYKHNYLNTNCLVFVSGYLPKNINQQLNEHFGQLPLGVPSEPLIVPAANELPKKVKINHEDSLQSAIRIGRQLFNRQHPDYAPFFVLNTVLGGYFGSRLMNNIREDKGYTYNIYSSLDSMKYDGYFYIGTEVGNEFVKPTTKEIFHEINRLQQDLVEDSELDMVRNYLLGTFLMNLDGSFNAIDVYKSLIVNDLPTNYFKQLVETIRQIEATQIRDLAQQYLQKDALWEVVVGD